jgi:tetratricopeptide (TPR) repeat protein
VTAQPPVPTEPEAQPPQEGQVQGGLNLDWAGYLREGEYRRALAAARLGQAGPETEAALEDLYDLRESVRARRLALARRQAEKLAAHLSELQAPGEFRLLVNVSGLSAGLEALIAAERERLSDAASLEAHLQPALEAPLTRAEALNTLGVLHALQEREAQARQLFGEAIACDAGHYRALTNLGNMVLEAGDASGAEQLYRQAIALNSDYAGAHHNLGVALRKQGRLNESVKAIKAGQRLSVRQTRRDQDDELRADPKTQTLVQRLRIVMLIVIVVLVLLAVRGHF